MVNLKDRELFENIPDVLYVGHLPEQHEGWQTPKRAMPFEANTGIEIVRLNTIATLQNQPFRPDD